MQSVTKNKQTYTDMYKSQQIWVVLLKEPEALLEVISSKNSNTLHFTVYTTCTSLQLDKPLI